MHSADPVRGAACRLTVVEADVLRQALDSYRQWAHQRSLQPAGLDPDGLRGLARTAGRLAQRITASTLHPVTEPAGRPHAVFEISGALTQVEDLVLWGALLDHQADLDDQLATPGLIAQAEAVSALIAHMETTIANAAVLELTRREGASAPVFEHG